MKMKGKGPKVSFNDVMVHEYVVEPRSSHRISARDDKDGVPHLEVSFLENVLDIQGTL